MCSLFIIKLQLTVSQGYNSFEMSLFSIISEYKLLLCFIYTQVLEEFLL